MFIKPVIFHSIGLMDIDANTANVRVEHSGGVKEKPVLGAGDNSVQTVDVGREAVNKVEVRMDRSGAVTFIDYNISLDFLVPTPSPSPSVSPSESPSSSPSESPTKSPTQVTTPPTAPPTKSPTPTPLGGIGGTVFEDRNNNGVQDAGEPGIEGVSVAIIDSVLADLSP
jgi:hypothetical protein